MRRGRERTTSLHSDIMITLATTEFFTNHLLCCFHPNCLTECRKKISPTIRVRCLLHSQTQWHRNPKIFQEKRSREKNS